MTANWAVVDDVVDAVIGDGRIVGTVVEVWQAGVPVYRRAAGLADREAGRAISSDDIFLLASATKPITSAAALALVEAGVVALETRVAEHLPMFRPPFEGQPQDITVRQLLTHTSGLYYPFQEPTDGPMHRLDVSSGLDCPGLSGPEAMERLGSVPLRFRPGAAYNYSLSLDVLGEVMAHAAGESLGAIVARTVTMPLGMPDTAFAVRDEARLVAHYGVDAGGHAVRMGDEYWGPTLVTPARMSPRRLFDSGSYNSGGGGMAGTARDLMGFLEALRLGGAPILGAASTRDMLANALPPHISQALEPGWGYGLGVETLLDPVLAGGPERPGAFKGSGGYGHRWFVDPELQLSAVILTNSAPEGVRGRFVPAMRDAIYAAASRPQVSASAHR